MLFVPTATPAADPTLIRRRKFGERYDVDSHSPSRTLFLTSNADGLARRAAPLSEQAGGAELLLLPSPGLVNRQLYSAPMDDPANWTPVAGGDGAPVLPHSASRSLDGVSAFDCSLLEAPWTSPGPFPDPSCR